MTWSHEKESIPEDEGMLSFYVYIQFGPFRNGELKVFKVYLLFWKNLYKTVPYFRDFSIESFLARKNGLILCFSPRL